MAEAEFAGEEIKEFPRIHVLPRFALLDAKLAEFPKDFLMRDGPRNGRNRKSNDKQRQQLQRHSHGILNARQTARCQVLARRWPPTRR
jgi:hypothetical protein